MGDGDGDREHESPGAGSRARAGPGSVPRRPGVRHAKPSGHTRTTVGKVGSGDRLPLRLAAARREAQYTSCTSPH